MKYLKIQNNGELDIRLIALMGGTTKSNNEYKIGQFGTGLKYTLAFLFRNNLAFKIFTGETPANMTIQTETIKEEKFDIICINGNRTSITTKMGLEWKAWMIIRELWCNALDEGGQIKEEVFVEDMNTIKGEAGKTTFYIQITEEIKTVLDNWNNFFVHDQEPLFSNDNVAIYSGGESLRIYKQGVLVKSLKGKKSLFSYDYKSATINELREFNGSVTYIVFECLRAMDVRLITHFLEHITEEHYEGSSEMDYSWYSAFGKQWREAIGSGKIIHKEAIQNIKSRGLSIDTSSMVTVPKKIYEALTKQFDGVGALRVSDKINEFYETYSSESDAKIKQGLVVLEEANYNFSPELKFIYGVFGDKNVWANVNMDTKEVFISENIADKSLFDVVTTLIEENEHYKSGHEDCSRQFQQHFINLYANQLLKNAEIIL